MDGVNFMYEISNFGDEILEHKHDIVSFFQ